VEFVIGCRNGGRICINCLNLKYQTFLYWIVPFAFVLNKIRRDLKEQTKQKMAEEEFA
jgi:hypothetical protein